MKKLTGVALLLAAILFVAAVLLVGSWSASGPAEKSTAVVVAEGTSLSAASKELEAVGVIASADRFLLLAKLLGGTAPIQAGEYEFPAGASPSAVLATMQAGQTLRRFITIPEGLPSILVHERLMAVDSLTGQVAVPDEGSVLPDSYSYVRGETRAAVLKRMQDAMAKELDALWAKRKPGIAPASPREAVILASVVEKETGKPSERRMVAGVYSNRVKIGMPLQADPTVIYPITKGKPLGRRIRQSELRAKNGYNTYAMAGLPVGPIANPGRESIAAVLDPAPTKALYFVADGAGGHVFADTLAEHNANVRKWYAIRKGRGEM